MKKLLLAVGCVAATTLLPVAQNLRMDTYCNPLNVDYTYMIAEFNLQMQQNSD